jgi:ribosome biogenesis protein UTP30
MENMVAAMEAVAACVPRKWRNVRALHIKCLESTVLSLYSAPGTGGEDNYGDDDLEVAKSEGTPTKEEQGRMKRRKKGTMGCNYVPEHQFPVVTYLCSCRKNDESREPCSF